MPEIHPISGACVWYGREMANSPRWRRRLSGAQLAEKLDIEGARTEAAPVHAFIIDKAPWFAVTYDLPNTLRVSPARTRRTIPDPPIAAIWRIARVAEGSKVANEHEDQFRLAEGTARPGISGAAVIAASHNREA